MIDLFSDIGSFVQFIRDVHVHKSSLGKRVAGTVKPLIRTSILRLALRQQALNSDGTLHRLYWLMRSGLIDAECFASD